MRKKLSFIVTLMVVVSVSTTILLMSSYNETRLLSKLALNNIETLTQNETANNWIDSHSVDLVSIVIKEGYWSTLTSREGLIYPFWIPTTREDISCCVLSNQSSKCNKAQLDYRCP